MNRTTSSSTSSTSRYSLLAHEFDMLPAPDDPPILEREDNSDLSTPAETLHSSPISSSTSFPSFPTSPKDTTHKDHMPHSLPLLRPYASAELPQNQGLVYDGGSETELDEPTTPPTRYAHIVQDKKQEASWTEPTPSCKQKRGLPGRARRRFGRVVREALGRTNG